MKTLTLSAALLSALVTLPLASQATGGPGLATQSSERAVIRTAQAYPASEGWMLRGSLAASRPMRGQIPGVLELQILDADNQLVSTQTLSYSRNHRASRQHSFLSHIETLPPVGGSLRLVHR